MEISTVERKATLLDRILKLSKDERVVVARILIREAACQASVVYDVWTDQSQELDETTKVLEQGAKNIVLLTDVAEWAVSEIASAHDVTHSTFGIGELSGKGFSPAHEDLLTDLLRTQFQSTFDGQDIGSIQAAIENNGPELLVFRKLGITSW